MGGRTAARAALGAVLLAALCAGAAAPPSARSPHGDELRVGALATQRLEVGRTPRSDVVGLWQSVLWADGYSDRSGVTCTYDTASARATRIWQSNHALSADGIVGQATWGAALDRLATVDRWTVYQGERYDLPLREDRGGYFVYDGGVFHRLHTGSVTLALCR